MKLYAVRIVVQSEIVQRSSAISKEIGDKPMCSESLILIACLFCAPVAVLDPVLKALWNLDRMSICKLGYPASVYNNYGCWCGVGGSGKPMDGIDRCCMKHDFCYDKAVGEGDCYDTAEEYLLPYNWKCIQNQSVCLNNANSKCGCAICACDSAIIKCWSRFEKPKIKVKCIKMDSDFVVRYPKPSFNILSLLNKIFSP